MNKNNFDQNKRQELKPRGFYKIHDKWSKDTTTEYFVGPMINYYWPAIKILCLIVLGCATQCYFNSLCLSIGACLIMTYSFPFLVSKVIPNTIVMPPMDHQCFISSPNVIVNYMNCTKFDDWNEETLYEAFKELFTYQPKFRYKIKEVMGDYYYEKMPIEELMSKFFWKPESDDKILRTQDDINQFIEDNLNEKLPLDGPQVRIYFQKYDPVDLDLAEGEKRPKGIMIWKCHHSFSDGISSGSLLLAISKEYDRSYFLTSKDAPWTVRILARVMAPF